MEEIRIYHSVWKTLLLAAGCLTLLAIMISLSMSDDFKFSDYLWFSLLFILLVFCPFGLMGLYLLLVVAIPLVLEMRTIFGWWLGDVSEDTIVYSRLIILYMVFMSMHNPVTTIVQATGRVKLYCLCVESVILCSLPATWLAFRLGAPSEACVVIMILSCLLAHIVRLFILHKLYPQFRFTPYLCGVVLPGGLSAMITALVVFGVHYIMTPSALKVFITFAAAAFVMLFSVYAFGVSKEERQMIRKFMFARFAV